MLAWEVEIFQGWNVMEDIGYVEEPTMEAVLKKITPEMRWVPIEYRDVGNSEEDRRVV